MKGEFCRFTCLAVFLVVQVDVASALLPNYRQRHNRFSTGTTLAVVAEPPGERKISPSKRRTDRLPKWTSTPRPKQVETLEDYKSVVVDEKERLVVVRFYSPVCRSCKAAEQHFNQLCRDHPDIKFVQVPTTKDNAFLHKGLGVTTFPFGHIYHPEAGLVEELKINKKVFGEFQRVLNYYVEGQGSVEYPEEGICEPAGCRVD